MNRIHQVKIHSLPAKLGNRVLVPQVELVSRYLDRYKVIHRASDEVMEIGIGSRVTQFPSARITGKFVPIPTLKLGFPHDPRATAT